MSMGDYNKFAQEYAKYTEEVEKKAREHFYSLITISLTGKHILDVGCGSGHDATHYHANGGFVHGIDISQKEIQMANYKGIGNFVVGNMETLPYANEQFDLVTSFYALQASENVFSTLSEMIRVTKPGGTILIATKHPFRNLLESHINDKKSDYFEKRKVTSYIFDKKIMLTEPGHTLAEYLHPKILKKAGLELIEEHVDFPASEQVIEGMNYPTYMILRFRKFAR